MLPPDQDGFACQLTRINPAHDGEAVLSIAIALREHEADLVHVRGDHHPQPILTRAHARSQDVPQRVHFHLLTQRFHFAQDDFAHFLLIARNSQGVAQLGQQVELPFSNPFPVGLGILFRRAHVHFHSRVCIKSSGSALINSAIKRPARRTSLRETVSTGVCI